MNNSVKKKPLNSVKTPRRVFQNNNCTSQNPDPRERVNTRNITSIDERRRHKPHWQIEVEAAREETPQPQIREIQVNLTVPKPPKKQKPSLWHSFVSGCAIILILTILIFGFFIYLGTR